MSSCANIEERKHKLSQKDNKENFSSPEHLMLSNPVRDAYSSDEAKDNTKKRKCENKMILRENVCSSKLDGVEVLFFFDLNYHLHTEPQNINNESVDDIVDLILTFLHQGQNENKIQNCSEFTQISKKGKKIDICTWYFENKPWLSWLREHDTCNLKEVTDNEWLKMNRMYTSVKHGTDCKYTQAVIEIVQGLWSSYKGNLCRNHEQVKDVLRLIDKLAPTNSKLRYSGKAEYELQYKVPKGFVSIAASNVVSSECCITVKPDSVFSTENKYGEAIGKLIAEVFMPSAELENELQNFEDKMKASENDSIKDPLPKPRREKDSILNEDYRKKAFEYLKQCVPKDCNEKHCLNKLTGQHILQLICLAHELKDNQSSCLTSANLDKVACGIFIKYHYVFFTKLVINDQKLKSFVGNNIVIKGSENHIEPEKGVVSFSNWCLDLTLPKHRHAFYIVILELLNSRKVNL